MANPALLQMLANPNSGGVMDNYFKGQEEGLRLADVLRQNDARKLQGEALSQGRSFRGPLAELLYPSQAPALDQLYSVDPERGMETKKFLDADKLARLDDFTASISAATTPEAYARTVAGWKARGVEFGQGEDAFEGRQKVLDQMNAFRQRLAGQSGEFGLNLVYGQDVNGNTVAFQPSKTGGLRPVQFPAGVTPAPGVSYTDTGTSIIGRNTKTGQVMSQTTKDVAGAERQKAEGRGVGERTMAQPQAKLTLDSTLSALDRLSSTALAIKENPALSKVTGWMSMVPNAPGGNAANVQARLGTLKSQIGFTVLQAMRDASKTGGALGQVSNFENEQLQNNLAALDQAQSMEEFQSALGQIIDYVRGAKGRLQAAYDQTYSGQQPQSSQQQSQGFKEGDYFAGEADIPEGAIVVDDDGKAFQKINGQLTPVQ